MKLESNIQDENHLVAEAQSDLAAGGNQYRNEETDFDSLIDPALMMTTPSAPPPPQSNQPLLGDAIQQLQAATDMMRQSTQDISTASRQSTAQPSRIEPTSTAAATYSTDKEDQQPGIPAQPEFVGASHSMSIAMAPTSSQTPVGSLASPPDSLIHDAGSPPTETNRTEVNRSIEMFADGSDSSANPLHTPKSASRHSSRQPKQVGRYVPEAASSTVKQPKKPASRRASSSTVSTLTSIDEQTLRSSSRASTAQPTVAATTRAAKTQVKAESPASVRRGASTIPRGRSSIGTDDMDEESLKLIRALQEQEFGLRRRSTRG
jgi:hypothetical protein